MKDRRQKYSKGEEELCSETQEPKVILDFSWCTILLAFENWEYMFANILKKKAYILIEFCENITIYDWMEEITENTWHWEYMALTNSEG